MAASSFIRMFQIIAHCTFYIQFLVVVAMIAGEQERQKERERAKLKKFKTAVVLLLIHSVSSLCVCFPAFVSSYIECRMLPVWPFVAIHSAFP